jgi:hypothetical protein
MRSLNQPFCAVCNQHWSLITFGHPRVTPTAPIESQSPDLFVAAWEGLPVDFSVVARLSAGAGVSNLLTWRLNSPVAFGEIVATGTSDHTHVFPLAGIYGLSLEIIADANFIKRSKDGPNRGVATWAIGVHPPPPEISAPGSPQPLQFTAADDLNWEDAATAGAQSYNVYRGDISDLPGGSYGDCLLPDVAENSTSVPGVPPASVTWFYLVTGVNPAGEGPPGAAASGAPRVLGTACDGSANR